VPTYSDDLIKSVLRSTKVIAMVGASANDMRPSYFAMKYLLAKGYIIHPINPGLAGKEILGQTVYASLKDVPAPVDISEEAETLAKEAGLTVIMDRCPKIEYGRLSGEIGWMGVNRKVIDNRKPLLFNKGGALRRS